MRPAVQFVVANPIGVATDATRSLAALGAIALAALIVAALLALGPGGARSAPTTGRRAERRMTHVLPRRAIRDAAAET